MLTYLGILLAARTKSERGSTAVEYGLLVASMAAVIVAVVWALGHTLTVVFEQTQSNLECTGCSSAS